MEQNPYTFSLPNGRQVFCNRPDKVHVKRAIQEFYELFWPLLRGQSMWVIDIGTSCGDSTVVMAACLALSTDSRVIAFEPSREIYPLLLENTSHNPCATYDIHNVAAGNANAMIDFVYGIDNGGLVIPELIPERERGPAIPTYKVPVVHTYQYLRTFYSINELDKIRFIKIDTEGYDFVVLNGLAPLIYRNRMPIIIEWWNDPNNSNLMFDEIEKLYYQAHNTRGELVNRFDFNTPKRTQDLILTPI